MKIVNSLKKGAVTLALFASVFLITRSQTDGFLESNIYREKGLSPSLSSETSGNLSVLDQPFSYLGHGTQSYVLVSQDGQYVLKFFRKDRASHPLLPLRSFLPSFVRMRLEKTLQKREMRRLKTFTSYQIAFEKLREETGLLGFYPSRNRSQILNFTDKIGVVHHLSLSGIPFLLQRRADPFYPTLLDWIHKGELDCAKRSLSELIKLLRSRCDKGVFDKDPDLKTNFGWIDGHPIQIDVGRFSLDEMRRNPNVYRNDLIRITDRLCIWLEEQCPELASHLRKERTL